MRAGFGRTRTLHMMLLGYFGAVFFVSLSLFVMVFELMDIFANLWRYINHDAKLADIGWIALLYLPKCVSYALPVALLFAISYTLGTYYINNEIIAVFGSGVSLVRLVTPLIATGFLLSITGFFFEDAVVIPTFKSKNDYARTMLGQTVSFSNTNVTISSGRFVYQAAYYNDQAETLNGLTVIEHDGDNRLVTHIEADLAEWSGDHWILRNCRVFRRHQDESLQEEWLSLYDSETLSEDPSIFRRTSQKIEEMSITDASTYIASLQRAGLPYEEHLSEFHRKFSFALTPLLVVIVASSIGGLFKKNFLFLSLIGSLGIVVGYYVLQMITMTMARNGYLSPVMGAWSALVIFTLVGLGQFKVART